MLAMELENIEIDNFDELMANRQKRQISPVKILHYTGVCVFNSYVPNAYIHCLLWPHSRGVTPCETIYYIALVKQTNGHIHYLCIHVTYMLCPCEVRCALHNVLIF